MVEIPRSMDRGALRAASPTGGLAGRAGGGASTDLRDTWPDLSDEGMSADAVRWKRAYTWRATFIFNRPAATLVAAPEDTHKILLWLHKTVCGYEEDETGYINRRLREEAASLQGMAEEERRRLGIRSTEAHWPPDYVASRMIRIHDSLAEGGAMPGAAVFVAIDRAVVRLLGRLRTQAANWPKSLGTPRLKRPHPRVVTLRLPCGQHYVPVERTGDRLHLDQIGEVEARGPLPDHVETCAYVEAALIRRQWWLRFIFAEEAPAREKKAKKGASDD